MKTRKFRLAVIFACVCIIMSAMSVNISAFSFDPYAGIDLASIQPRASYYDYGTVMHQATGTQYSVSGTLFAVDSYVNASTYSGNIGLHYSNRFGTISTSYGYTYYSGSTENTDVCLGNAFFSCPVSGDTIIHASALFNVNICENGHARNTAYTYWTGSANF